MNQFLILLSTLFSINFLQMNHPLAMGLNLLIQTILISMICGFISSSYWFAYILFLIMLGGMLVLFIYVTSLASNELFSFSMNNFLFMIFLFIIMLMILLINDNFIWLNENYEIINFNSSINMTNFENELTLMKLYNNPTMNITLMMINYLFLTLIIIVKITNINYGSLRQKN
uniref:NADH-ubiquinone oxidoreductase chain 6 n=1 Tax=Polystoechotes punctata TaxID=2028677 RepID=B5U4F9_9NEOP|nr:NADH dehydrogenase subunit 6 [Polystoechotes punctata]ACH90011.1 NADH dehydrogenase subunit 6 [Polystoechotes punctata]